MLNFNLHLKPEYYVAMLLGTYNLKQLVNKAGYMSKNKTVNQKPFIDCQMVNVLLYVVARLQLQLLTLTRKVPWGLTDPRQKFLSEALKLHFYM